MPPGRSRYPRTASGSDLPPAQRAGLSAGRLTLVMVGAVAIVLVLVLAAAGAFSGGGSHARSQSSSSPATGSAPQGSAAPTAPATGHHRGALSHGRIAVLNGTTVPGLGRRVADRLVSAGYRVGTVTNASNQQQPTTLVSYAPGAQAEAQAVARQVGVSASAVAPLDPSTQVIARGAAVVVTVGADSSH